jgi:hypothetical protein
MRYARRKATLAVARKPCSIEYLKTDFTQYVQMMCEIHPECILL